MLVGRCTTQIEFVAFVMDTLSFVIQCNRTVGNTWGTLFSKHGLRESGIALEREYEMFAVFLIESKVAEEQEKITQIVTGALEQP